MYETRWDPHLKLFIAGPSSAVAELTEVEPTPVISMPDGYHRCNNYTSIKNDNESFRYVRCSVYIPKGEEYCNSHFRPATKFVRYCRWGPCKVKLYTDTSYCEFHSQKVHNPDAKWDFDDALVVLPGDEPQDAEWLAIDETKSPIDWSQSSKIGWSPVTSRLQRKQYTMDDMHFRLELRGSRDEIDLFHAIVHLMDHDYPLDPFRKVKDTVEVCNKCQCSVWKACILTPHDLKKAAKQAGIRVKIRQYISAEKCIGKVNKVVATA